jgi:hypothetical protein
VKKFKKKLLSKFKEYFLPTVLGTTIGITAANFTATIANNFFSKPNLNRIQRIVEKVDYKINDHYLPYNKTPEVILIGDIHGKVNNNIEIILNNLVSNNDEILIESPTELTNLQSAISREYLHNLLSEADLKNISINGSDNKKLTKLSLEVLAFKDLADSIGDTIYSQIALNEFIELAYKRDHFSFSPKIKKSVEKNRLENNNYKKKLNLEASSETYQVIGALHLEMDEIRRNLRESDISYVSIIPNKIYPEQYEKEYKKLMENVRIIYKKSREKTVKSKDL